MIVGGLAAALLVAALIAFGAGTWSPEPVRWLAVYVGCIVFVGWIWCKTPKITPVIWAAFALVLWIGISILWSPDWRAGVMRLDGAGWHLDGPALRAATQRPLPAGRWVSAACHTRDDLLLAARAGADFVTLSPVLPTLSHPGAPTLGWTSSTAALRPCSSSRTGSRT